MKKFSTFFCLFLLTDLLLGLWSGNVFGKVYLYSNELYIGESADHLAPPYTSRMPETKPFFEGGPGSVSSPYTVYIPLDTDDDDGQNKSREKYTFFGHMLNYVSAPDGGGGFAKYPALPSIVAGAPPSFADRPYLRLAVYHDSTTNKYLCGALKGQGSSTYRILNSPNFEVATNSAYFVNFYFSDMYSTDPANTLNLTTDGADLDNTLYLYIFEMPPNSTPNCTTLGTDISVDTYPGGLYLKLRVSSAYDFNSTGQVSMVSLRSADSALLAKFDATSSTVVNKDILNTMVVTLMPDKLGNALDYASFSHTRDLIDFLLANRTSKITYYPPQFSGEIKTGELVNGRQYQVGVMTLSKFGFTSNPSINLTLASSPRTFMPGTPQSIDTFIQKQSCFLLSAGFGEEHFVIDYFKDFRDQVLTKFALGKIFIQTYYGTAPKYTRLIYQSRVMSFIVRCIGYFMFYLFRSFLFWFPLLVLVASSYFWRRRHLN